MMETSRKRASGKGGMTLHFQKAFDEFFRVLPDFLRDRREIGSDGILSRFADVQDQLLKAFEKDLK